MQHDHPTHEATDERPERDTLRPEQTRSAVDDERDGRTISPAEKHARIQSLVEGQNQVLEMIAQGSPLAGALEVLVRIIEKHATDGALASILLLDDDGIHLQHGAAPNLPAAYSTAIDGIVIGAAVGSCGTAAYLREQVIVSDTAKDPLWKDYRQLALAHNLRACWSTPIFSSNKEVLGTFAMYYHQPYTPSVQDRELIAMVTRTAALVIERQRSERVLHLNQERLRIALASSYTGTFRWDPFTGEFLEFDDSLKRLFGLVPDETIRTTEDFIARIHPDDVPALLPAVDACRQGADFEMEYRVVHPDGSIHWLYDRARMQRDANGALTYLVGACTDITKRKQTEEALRQSEERLRLMAESMPQKIFTAKPNGDIDYFNPQWMEFTGLSFAQIRDWGWVQFIHPDDVEENIRRWRHSINTGEPFELEHRFRRADGVYHWHVSRAIPIRDASGNVTMWIGSNTDIDEQKRAEEALRVAEEQKEQFIAGITHDLKTPLTTIKGGVQLLGRQARRSGTDEMTRALPRLQAIDDAATRMIGMIDDLLDAARMRGGHAPSLERTTTDLVALARRVAVAQEPRASKRRIVVETDAPEIFGQWDAREVERVLENLLSNACKYSPEGSAITVTLTRATDSAGAWAVLTVTDRGIGIPAADLPHIFERFYRARNVQRVEGSGIGLVGAKQIVEQHGGTIAITSAEGDGTTVVVRLPLTDQGRTGGRD